MKDQYKVVTPENVELNYAIAGIGSRFLALAIDGLLQWILIIGVLSCLHMLKLNTLQSKIIDWRTSLTGSLLIGLLFVVLIGYYIIFETFMNGQTIGKRLINIRVRKEGGYAPSFWDILLRNIVRMADFLPSFYLLGLAVMFTNKKAKRLGDYAAGTIVVKELPRRKFKRFFAEQAEKISVAPENLSLMIDKYPELPELVSFIGQVEYSLMRNLYLRRHQLTNSQILAQTLLKNILSHHLSVDDPLLNNDESLAILTVMLVLYENNH
jgi:uncharacterized RDD family membrane protein YckC